MPNNLLSSKKFQPLQELADLTRKVAAEGIVLLENKNNVLPIRNEEVAIFGRIQSHYYNSGTGSGGLVNVKHIPSFIEAFLASPLLTVNKKLKEIYEEWTIDNPFDEGNGQWASEPWSQIEMEVSADLVKEISGSVDSAIVLIGRTAGEDRDHYNGEGSYLLTNKELDLISKVSRNFKKTIVILNCGNTIDTSFVNDYKIDGLIYAFAGGIMGAHALVDVVTGLVNPSGRLTNTIAKNINDYAANEQFGLSGEVYYVEDIYVGYRYFETFAKEKVLYPFGYGLSYTKFNIEVKSSRVEKLKIELKLRVTNQGDYIGKEVVQIYLEAPNGKLGKTKKVLVGFVKTKELNVGESQDIVFDFNLSNFASYDDSGKILENAYLLEKGSYYIYVGNNVRDTGLAVSHLISDNVIVEQLKETIRPRKPFKRMVNKDGLIAFEDVSLKTKTSKQLMTISEEIVKNNNNYNLEDVYYGKITSKQFVESLNEVELSELVRGEGMSSPKVTPGTAAAFGGVTEKLKAKGIPIMCAADGPSGIRMDSGLFATSLPAGVALAATFNLDLVAKLYQLTGLELRAYDIDLLLGPGLNINRHPLNGRNFEYFSEDPLLGGMMASAVLKGLASVGVSGSLKHLSANNQETDRFNVDAIVSERAMREIYLKTFEIPVKAGADCIMTSYNPINGIWAASNYEINQMIVRDEWGFKGIIITDWWAKMNDEGEDAFRSNTKAMLKSSNDLYMVISDSLSNSGNDNTLSSLESGELSLNHLQNAALNIINFSLKSPAFFRGIAKEFVNSKKVDSSWFNYQQNKITINSNLAITINGKEIATKRGIFNYQVSDELIKEVKTNNPYFLSKDFKNLIVISNYEGENYLYHFKVMAKNENNNLKLPFSPLITISARPWDSNIIKLNEYVKKSDSLFVNDFITTNGVTQSITYAIFIKEAAKYVFEFDVSVKTSELAQVPFSIFINSEHRSTLTLRDTKDETVKVKAFIIIDEGFHHLTFNFNKSGIIIKQVNILRHG